MVESRGQEPRLQGQVQKSPTRAATNLQSSPMQHLDGRTDAKAKVQEPRSNPHDVAGDGETGESWTASGDFYGIFYQFSMKPIFGQLPNAFSLWREHHVGEKSHAT